MEWMVWHFGRVTRLVSHQQYLRLVLVSALSAMVLVVQVQLSTSTSPQYIGFTDTLLLEQCNALRSYQSAPVDTVILRRCVAATKHKWNCLPLLTVVFTLLSSVLLFIYLFAINIVHGVQVRQGKNSTTEQNRLKLCERVTVSHSSQNAYTMSKIIYIIRCKPLRQH